MIHFHYAGEVEWFCSLGISKFERSTFGPMLDRARLFGDVPRERDPELAAARRERKKRMETTGAWEPDPGEITARPTCETRESAREEPRTEVLERYGLVSARLKHVSERDPLATTVLTTFHGDSGAQFAFLPRGPGRIASLFKIVPAGKRILAKSRQRTASANLQVTDDKRMQNEIMRSWDGSGVFSVAEAESLELYSRAADLYSEVARVIVR